MSDYDGFEDDYRMDMIDLHGDEYAEEQAELRKLAEGEYEEIEPFDEQFDERADGDFDSAMRDAGLGMDEDYDFDGYGCHNYEPDFDYDY